VVLVASIGDPVLPGIQVDVRILGTSTHELLEGHVQTMLPGDLIACFGICDGDGVRLLEVSRSLLAVAVVKFVVACPLAVVVLEVGVLVVDHHGQLLRTATVVRRWSHKCDIDLHLGTLVVTAASVLATAARCTSCAAASLVTDTDG